MPSTVARILKVNHGGEHGAIRIYAGQIAAARIRCPGLVADLMDLRSDEQRHEQVFLALMPERGARPCRMLWLWGLDGLALGLFTGLIGRDGIFVCTHAVEQTVHGHLDHQLAWLGDSDPNLSVAITDIQREEEDHLRWAMNGRKTVFSPLATPIRAIVEALIWLSTNGESAALARTLRAKAPAAPAA